MLARSARRAQAFTRRDAVRALIAASLLIAALAVILSIDTLPGPLAGPGAVSGDVALVDIQAPRAGTVPSEAATAQRRDEARQQVPPQYDYTFERAQAIAEQQGVLLEETLAPVDAAFNAILTPIARADALDQALPDLSTQAGQTLAAMDRVEWTALRGELVRVLDQAQRVEVRDTVLADARGGLANRVGSRFAADQRALVGEILAPLLVANSTFDPALTDLARNEAAARVDQVQFNVQRGEIIVRAGERIDAVARDKLAYFGLLEPASDPARAGGWLLLAGLVVGLLLGWLWRFRPQFWHRANALLLIALVLVASAVALKVTGDRSLVPFVLPLAAAGLLLSVLLDSGVATIAIAIIALLAGAIVGTVEFAAYVFFGGLAGIIVVRRGERLANFVQAAAAMAIANLAVVTLFTLLGDRDFTGLFELWGAGLLAAAGAAVAAAGSFVVLGSLFGITTSFLLLELANPSQPLLRRLLLETPGTYHHSLMVGNLAERAAEAIEADPLLARVAAYYHDIGKLANPMAFIENQAGTDNPHDEMSPEQSVTVLKAHVANGIDLAYRYRLPKSIIPFIPQHHGTALMSYFYARAREHAVAAAGARPGTPQAKAAEATVDQSRFRHAGPKPQSKEAAILMLADGVEASVRSLTSQEEPAIRAMVQRIIRERLEDGQFDECDLTLRDVELIREAFVQQLLGMYHRRVEYPQNKIVEIESRRAQTGTGA